MKKKIIALILALSFFTSNIQASESQRVRAEAAASSSFNATAMSMVFWGVLLTAGIASAAILINSSSAHS